MTENNLPPELVEALRELTEVLRENAQAMKGSISDAERLSKANKQQQQSSESLTRAQKDQQSAVEALRAAEEKAAKEKQKLEEAQKLAFYSTERSLKGFAGALFSTEQSMGKYADSVTSAGEAAWQLGKAFGVGGAALGGLIKGASMLFAANLKQTDAVLKASDELAKVGGAGGITGQELLSLAHKAGLTSKNLDNLVKPLKSLGPTLMALGDTASSGMKAFADLTAITRTQRMEMQRLGVSQEELIQNQADYIKLQVMSGKGIRDELNDKVKLQKASLEYTENLAVLAKLSGEEVGGLKQKQKEAQYELEWQIRQANLTRKAQEARNAGDLKTAEMFEKMAKGGEKSINYFASFNDPNLLKGVRQFMSTGALSGEESVKIARLGLGDALAEMKRNIEAGADAEMESAKFKDKYDQAIRDRIDREKGLGTAFQFNKQVADDFAVTAKSVENATASQGKSAVDMLKKSRDEVAAGKKPGKDPMQDARAKQLETERALQKSMDILVSKFGFTTIATGALGIAAVLAAKNLGILGGIGGGGGMLGKIGDLIKDKGGVKGAAGSVWKSTASAITGSIDKLKDIVASKGGVGGMAKSAWSTSAEAFKSGAGALKEAIAARGGLGAIIKTAGVTIAEGAKSAASIIAKAASVAFDLAKSGMGKLTDLIASRGGIGKILGGAGQAAGSAAGTAGKMAMTGVQALGKFAGPLAAVVTAGVAAKGAYDEYQDIKKKEETGEISKAEASKKKTEAVGGGVGAVGGGVGGALAGAAAGAAIGSVVPILGTAIGGLIGGALGGWLGTKGGDAIGRTAAKGINMMKDSADKKTDEAMKKIDSKEHSAMNKGTFAGIAMGALLGPIGMIVGGVIGNKLNKNAKEKEERAKEAEPLLLTKPQDKGFAEIKDLKDPKDLPVKSMFDDFGKMLLGGIPIFGAAFTAYDKIKDVDIKGKMGEIGASIAEGLDETKSKIGAVGEAIGSTFADGVTATKDKVSKVGGLIGSTLAKGAEGVKSVMNTGTMAGAAMGALLGPIGMLLGGFIGNKLSKAGTDKPEESSTEKKYAELKKQFDDKKIKVQKYYSDMGVRAGVPDDKLGLTKANLRKSSEEDEEDSPFKSFEDVLKSANISLRGLVISFTKWDKLLKESIEKEEELLKDGSKKGFLAKLAERLPGQQKAPGQPGASAAPSRAPAGTTGTTGTTGTAGAAPAGTTGTTGTTGTAGAAPAGTTGTTGTTGTSPAAATPVMAGAPGAAPAAAPTGPDGKPAQRDPDAAAQSGVAGAGPEKKELTTTKPKNITVQQTADISGVDSSLLSAFYTAAEEYGKQISINSAYRGDKKQAELWVRGRILNEPGIYTPAAPKNDTTIDYKGQTYNVKGSGRGSSHGDGNALDVTADWSSFDPILRKYGLHRPYASNDPPHVEKIRASDGGIATGPETGYPATLHGTEAIVPLEPNSILEKISKATTTTNESIESVLSPSAVKDSGTDNMIREMVNANVEMYNLLSEKLDQLIETMGEGNDTSKKLLRRQMI